MNWLSFTQEMQARGIPIKNYELHGSWGYPDDFIANFPNRILRPILARWVFPWGRSYRAPKDQHSEALLKSMLTHSDFRTRLLEKIYVGNHQSPLHCVDQAFQAVLSVAPLEKKLREGIKEGSIPVSACFEEQLMIGARKGLFTADEINQMEKF